MPISIEPSLFTALLTLVGLCVGSFLNVVIYRLPKMMERQWQEEIASMKEEELPSAEPFNLARPSSRCGQCGQRIRVIDNIPLVSYALLRGKCHACKASISWRYPLVELLAGMAGCACAWHFGATWVAVAAAVFIWVMLALTFIDLDTFLLPDDLTLPLLWLGLLINIQNTFVSLPAAVIGAAAGYLTLWIIYWLFKLATGKEGMGYGDFKLLAAIGAWLGWQSLPIVVLLSSFVGALVGVGLMLFKNHKKDAPIPFGPYLAVAGVIALFFDSSLQGIFLH